MFTHDALLRCSRRRGRDGLGHWGQVHVFAGDMQGENTVRLEMAEVELEGLTREQVHRHGVPTEGV